VIIPLEMFVDFSNYVLSLFDVFFKKKESFLLKSKIIAD